MPPPAVRVALPPGQMVVLGPAVAERPDETVTVIVAVALPQAPIAKTV